MKVTRIGLDIAKQIFELHGVDRRGRVVVRKTLRRERVLEYFSQLPACEVALEACGGAHYWQREIGKLGHTVRLLPTNKVKPYLDGNKNNAHDAAAICEASSRPSMRWVEPKTIAQQDLQSLHRVRQVTVRQSTYWRITSAGFCWNTALRWRVALLHYIVRSPSCWSPTSSG